MAPPISWTIASGRYHIAYTVAGRGPRDILFSPNWFSNCELIWEYPTYRRFLDRLASFARLIIFDRRGTGLSDPLGLDEVPTLDDRVADAIAVLDAVGSMRPVVVSNGVGAYLASYFAATRPDRISGVVLLDASAATRRTADYPIGMPDSAHDRVVELRRRWWGTTDLNNSPAWRSGGDAEFSARYQRQSMSPGRVDAEMRFNYQIDVRDLLGTIRVPALVVHHTDNPQIRVSNGRYLADGIPGARFVELDGGQFFWADDGDRVADLIQSFVTGEAPREAVTTHLATVVYTDLVGSTEQAAALGDQRWHEVLDRHEAAVRRQLAQHAGVEVKTLGDGFLATFTSVQAALTCAAAMVADTRAEGLHLRVGVHTGEIERRGADIGGIAVAVASRVLALAGPDEILASQTVKDLVLGSTLEFAERGSHELKGIPGEWRVWALQ